MQLPSQCNNPVTSLLVLEEGEDTVLSSLSGSEIDSNLCNGSEEQDKGAAAIAEPTAPSAQPVDEKLIFNECGMKEASPQTTESTPEPQTHVVRAFWDMERAPLPAGMSVLSIITDLQRLLANRIRSLSGSGVDLRITVFLRPDSGRVSEFFMNELKVIEVDMILVSKDKEDFNRKIGTWTGGRLKMFMRTH
jgi:hypothetical protein